MNYVQMKNGVTVDLNLPAEITSFSTETTSSHVSRAVLKVFSIGKTGDIRVFTKDFAESLVESLPGTPVIAYYDDEQEDFKGHNATQYVYGYVPEDAIPSFVEEDGKTWIQVDINLFTEREDNIGTVARRIIGKAQSLELNPDTTDWDLIYVNNKLEKIVFKKGSFYGLSVLGDTEQPAFEGAGFFKPEIIESLKSFRLKKDGGNEMNKTKFLSLNIQQKREELAKLIQKHLDLNFSPYVIDFTEEEVVFEYYNPESDNFELYLAPYSWTEELGYTIGEAVPAMITYVKKNSSNPSDFAKKEEESVDGVIPTVNDSEVEKAISEESVVLSEEKATEEVIEEPSQESADEILEETAEEQVEAVVADNAVADSTDAFVLEGETEERDENETNTESENFAKEEKEEISNQEVAAEFAALSSEERNELEELRKEKKFALIASFKNFLSEETLEKFKGEIANYNIEALEQALKIAAFEENKNKMNHVTAQETFNIMLPSVENKKQYHDEIDDLVATYIN